MLVPVVAGGVGLDGLTWVPLVPKLVDVTAQGELAVLQEVTRVVSGLEPVTVQFQHQTIVDLGEVNQRLGEVVVSADEDNPPIETG